MKKLLFTLFMVCMSIGGFAQTLNDTLEHVVYKKIPYNLSIHDKIFFTNKTSYTIQQFVVGTTALKSEHKKFKMKKDEVISQNWSPFNITKCLADAYGIFPSGKVEVASFDHNYLNKLRGQFVAFKLKGVKKNAPEKYDFVIYLEEKDHDLYVTIREEGANPFEF